MSEVDREFALNVATQTSRPARRVQGEVVTNADALDTRRRASSSHLGPLIPRGLVNPAQKL